MTAAEWCIATDRQNYKHVIDTGQQKHFWSKVVEPRKENRIQEIFEIKLEIMIFSLKEQTFFAVSRTSNSCFTHVSVFKATGMRESARTNIRKAPLMSQLKRVPTLYIFSFPTNLKTILLVLQSLMKLVLA